MAKAPVQRFAVVNSKPDPWSSLRRFTSARIGLGRAGGSIPTQKLLEFQLAHARARDAVNCVLHTGTLQAELSAKQVKSLVLASAAPDRHTYIQRPDLGRILSDESKALLESKAQQGQPSDIVFVIADGLSALAAQRHAVPLLATMQRALQREGWRVAPCCIVTQGRVAIADEIGALLSAQISVMLIGERPGLSSPDSLGAYLTWNPTPGRSNAQRNCVSNIRPEGLSYAAAAFKLLHLLRQARDRKLSGLQLKEDAALPGAAELLKMFPDVT
ncbi:MAG: ethanolamine ammonia-lyase subunit EutC [Betaproteobacteria bacterium]